MMIRNLEDLQMATCEVQSVHGNLCHAWQPVPVKGEGAKKTRHRSDAFD